MKHSKLIGILLISLLLLTTTVYGANDSYQTTLSVSSNEVKQGQTITFTIGLNNISIESGEKGIGAYSAKLTYDSSVLEYVKTEGTTNWEAPTFQNGLLVGNTKDGSCVSTAQSIGTVTFKVKENAVVGKTTIQLTSFLGSNAVNDISSSNQPQKEITIVSSSTNNNNDNKTDSNTDTNSNENTSNTNSNSSNNNSKTNNKTNSNSTKSSTSNSNSNSSNSSSSNNSKTQSIKQTSTSKDATTSTKKMPYTGNEYSFIWVSIIILACIAVISYIFCIKVKNKK